jgi:hypothetical protein
MQEEKTFKCCRCKEVRPFIEAWCTWSKCDRKYWCDRCEDKNGTGVDMIKGKKK